MPIKVPNNLPAIETLTNENVFVMTDTRAMTQDMRPLHILLLNLMPTKIDTETQITRMLSNTPLQVELELLQTATHKPHVTSQEHMLAFYKTFSDVKNEYYDGMIITGAPIELLEFEEVNYWEELCEIMEWSKTHVHSTFHICWGAQAGLYYHYGINKKRLPKKLSGVFKHTLKTKRSMLFRGFDDEFYVPQSRNTTVDEEDIDNTPGITVLSTSEEGGVFCVKSDNDRQIFVTGHTEYDWNTLLKEYVRDKEAGINPEIPANYFPDDDDSKKPVVRWRSSGSLLFSNWLNYFVYQSTPYDIKLIHNEDLAPALRNNSELTVAKFGGSSLATAERIRNAAEVVRQNKARRYVVVSAPGVHDDEKVKITDLLISAHENPDEFDTKMTQARNRFKNLAIGLGSEINIDEIFDKIIEKYKDSRCRDYLISRGEFITAQLMAEQLQYDFVDAAEVIKFDDTGKLLDDATRKNIEKLIKNHKRIVFPGFYGSNEAGEVTTFSRGGSDITGAIIAAAAKADLYENWTDVPGLLMADPRIVKHPLSVPVIIYKELRELALRGAEVLHEDAVR
ncbi:MAG: homoserine O-succinyltransferase, partial [Mogibacterium diversum]|nr:homoserine O-succinyltransferase [Mogibacterium diversum]